jgi:hypothetical protein
MRIPGQHVLLLSGLLVAAVASVSAQSQSVLTSPSPTPATNLDLLQQPAAGMAIDQYRFPVHSFGPVQALKNITPMPDAVCYTMRSYKVERSEKLNDDDGVVGYSTCQPSSRFEFKDAVETVTDPQ